ncbi:MAG: hypothetical protein RLZZ214_752 [Verrucomicrobiota bacterium]|jgi:predicted nucleic acid-binding protein
MNALGVVVTDTTPLNYLIVIDRAEILAALFGEVLIPEAVIQELRHPKAPAAVSRWLQELPVWLRIAAVQQMDETIQLGKGENEAISLALERQVKVVLMDERQGRGAAEARGLLPVGTLNLIDLADELGLIDGIAALNDLRQTTFRADPELLRRFEARMKARQG